MRSIVIGGNFGDAIKASSIMEQISLKLKSELINGGTIETLIAASNVLNYDLVLWSVNVPNDVEKIYPKKSNGSVLFCTKVIRENRNFGDAVARIFKMNANAVIAIDSSAKPFKFDLIDALGNNWCSTTNVEELVTGMLKIYNWTKGSIRIKSNKTQLNTYDKNLDVLCNIVKIIADKVENERGGRYFGNVSTRCSKLFPSMKINDDLILVSARNSSKERLSSEDFVFTQLINNEVAYNGDKKPSVDTPIQLNLYNRFKEINFIVHGHAYIKEADFTEHYYPCGDLRELLAIEQKLSSNPNSFVLNLKNHGFIIGTNSLESLRYYADNLLFTYRRIGEEKIEW